MKTGFRKAAIVYKYLAILFAIGYWIIEVIDDWTFIEQYWTTHWLEYIGIWTGWFVMYFLFLSFYYWIAATIVIFVYYKVIQRKKETTN